MNPRFPIALLVSCLILCSCKTSKPENRSLKRGLDLAEREFRSVRTNVLARLSFQNTLEQGGTLTSFLAASAPPEEGQEDKLPRYCNDNPCGPNSIALSYESESGEIVIEAYGEEQSEPIEERRVKIEIESLLPTR